MLVGRDDHPPREVVWYLSKTILDPERMESRNSGLILRVAEADRLAFRFHPRGCAGLGTAMLSSSEQQVWDEQIAKWTEVINKYGVKCLDWLPRASKKLKLNYIVLAGSAIKPGRVNFDALYERLVL